MPSANLQGLVPHKVLRWGGYIGWDDPLTIPNGLAIDCVNMAFLAESVKTRWGLQDTMASATDDGNATGLDVLTVLGTPSVPSVQQAPGGGSRGVGSIGRRIFFGFQANALAPNTQFAVVFSDQGKLYFEINGSGVLAAMSGANLAASIAALLQASSLMQTAKAYNRIYEAFTTLLASTGPVLVYDAATGWESQLGQNPIAAAWQASTIYYQGDIVTSSTNPAVWFRRVTTGKSGANEPIWPTTLGFFTPGYVPNPAKANDNGVVGAWEEWTMGINSFIPAPANVSNIADNPGGGTIPSGKDVYVQISFINDQGESFWGGGGIFSNTASNDALTLEWDGSTGGPPMPTWMLNIFGDGTQGSGSSALHWPPQLGMRIYVAAVNHGSAGPSSYRLYATVAADNQPVITSIPGSGPTFTLPTTNTAVISTQQFMGETGTRNAILLRQDTMGNLSPVDPQAVTPVPFIGAVNVTGFACWDNLNKQLQLALDDVTQFIGSSTVNISGAGLPAGFTGQLQILDILYDQTVNFNPTTGLISFTPANFPAGVLVLITTATAANAGSAAATLTLPAGPCPVAVVPPGSQEGPGYSYDVLAFTVSGIGPSGPFTYLASANPANPASSLVLLDTIDANGNAVAYIQNIAGFNPGDTVLLGPGLVPASYNGLRTIASVSARNSLISFYDGSPAGHASNGGPITVVQTQPTQAPSGNEGILLQFDDTSLPEGVDVTGNLLFVCVPPCTDLAYIPSVQRMAFVSDLYPTQIVFSEADFMGEVDGENDVLGVEPSNGSKLAGVRELLNGIIIAGKETGGYQIVPNASDPVDWGINRLWGIHGPQSGRNIGTGRDGTTGLDFFIFFDPESGLFKWPPTLGQGELDWLSKELSGANNQDASRKAIMDRVNRAAGAQIQVVVDDIAKEVKVAVPLDNATKPSHILTMSYFNGWQDPLLLTLSGEWVANRQARRWNIDPIPTQCMAMVKRTLATPIDQRVNYHQLIIGETESTPELLALQFMQPGVYDDNGAGYLCKYRPAYASEPPSQQWPNGRRFLRFAAMTGFMLGAGTVCIEPVTNDPTYVPKPHFVSLDDGEPEVPGSAPITDFAESMKGDNYFLTVEFSNAGEDGLPIPGAWFQLLELTEWYQSLRNTK